MQKVKKFRVFFNCNSYSLCACCWPLGLSPSKYPFTTAETVDNRVGQSIVDINENLPKALTPQLKWSQHGSHSDHWILVCCFNHRYDSLYKLGITFKFKMRFKCSSYGYLHYSEYKMMPCYRIEKRYYIAPLFQQPVTFAVVSMFYNEYELCSEL